MALNDNQEQIVYDAIYELLKALGVINGDTSPSLLTLVQTTEHYTDHLKLNGDYRDALIKDCFNALERRHADDLVDDLKERYGLLEDE